MNSQCALKIFVIDDDEGVRWLLDQTFKESYEVLCYESAEDLLHSPEGIRDGIYLIDLNLPGKSGFQLCAEIAARKKNTLTVVITGNNTLENTVHAFQHSIFDFLIKPFEISEVEHVVQNAGRQLLSEKRKTRGAEIPGPNARMIGKSREIGQIYKSIAKVAPANLPVLIEGESGTGKELIAKLIHEFSPRKDAPFVAVNCAAIPKELMESEFFGHVKGSFTGAYENREGKISLAEGGTLFLDELGELSTELQGKLLRVLQDGFYQPVGSPKARTGDFRLISATNKNLSALCERGIFREDLFYRVSVFKITSPPLRERRSDIISLFDFFMNKYSAEMGVPPKELTPEAAQKLCLYDWPGNVRELENFTRSLLINCKGAFISPEEISPGVAQTRQKSDAPTLDDLINGEIISGKNIYENVISKVEEKLISRVLTLNRGNQLKTADQLGINRNTLRKKIDKLGLKQR